MTTPYPTAAAVVAAAKSQLGTVEQGKNRTVYGRAYGMDGNPWCGMFVWWCFWHADGLDLRELGIYPAYTPAFHDQARARGWAPVDLAAVRAGDVVFQDFAAGGDRVEHVGLAVGDLWHGSVVPTVDGNTRPDGGKGQGDGDGVYPKQRHLAVVRAILRPPYATSSTPGSHAGVTITRVLALPAVDEGHRWAAPFARGEDVRAVQHLVRVAVDGVYGPLTARAVRLWQLSHGVKADGVWGQQSTRAAGWRWLG